MAQFPSPTSAYGTWSLNEVRNARRGDNWPLLVIPDPFFNQTTLLLHGDGTNGGQNNTFLDSSTNNFTITRNGNTTQGSFNPYSVSGPYNPATHGGSGYFDGAGDYLSVPSNPDLVLGTGDFTVEFWVYFDAVNNSTVKFLYDFRNASATSSSFLAQEANNSWTYFNGAAASIGTGWTSGTFTISTWHHIAICRSSGTTRFFVDGASTSSVADTSNYANGTFVLASRFNGQNFLNGYIADARIIKGTALYTSAFTPPTAPLTAVTNTSLLCNFTNAAIFDSTAKNVLETVGDAQIDTAVVKYGTGSMEFDGAGDWVVVRNEEDIGTGDFTVEFWVNYNTISSGAPNRRIFSMNTGGNVASNLQFCIGTSSENNGGIFVFSSVFIHSVSASKSDGAWHHVAVSRQSGQSRFFIDGVQQGSAVTNTQSFTLQNSLIGTRDQSAGSTNFAGYIDDLRITKGVARYTAAFTPPAAAFPDQ